MLPHQGLFYWTYLMPIEKLLINLLFLCPTTSSDRVESLLGNQLPAINNCRVYQSNHLFTDGSDA